MGISIGMEASHVGLANVEKQETFRHFGVDSYPPRAERISMRNKPVLFMSLAIAIVSMPAASVAEAPLVSHKLNGKPLSADSVTLDGRNGDSGRQRVQQLRVGTHGNLCIYDENDEVLHHPIGVSCDGSDPAPHAPAKASPAS